MRIPIHIIYILYVPVGAKYPLFAEFYTKSDSRDYYDYVKIVYKETDGYYNLWVGNYPYSLKNAVFIDSYNWFEDDYVNESRKILQEVKYVVEMIDNGEISW